MVDRLDTGFQTANFTPITSPSQVASTSTVSVDTGNNAAGPATVSVPLGFIGQSQSAAAALTAHAGGTKAAALLIGYGFSNLSVVATAADSILLPPAVAGAWCAVSNNGAASAQVFGGGTSTIRSVATGTGVALANAKTALFFCTKGVGDDLLGEWQYILTA